VVLPAVKILIVDDQPNNLTALEAILGEERYDIVTATSGNDALKCLLQHDFAVILLDVMMPDMDGFEVASLVRQRERSRHTPIIFLSATGNDTAYSMRSYEVGAVDYLTKPSDPDVVRAKVGVFAELFRKNAQIRLQSEALREHERREQALQVAQLQIASERHYRNLAEAIPQIVWTADANGKIAYFNQRWFELTGRSTDNSSGFGWLEALHPDEREVFTRRWNETVAAGEPFMCECRLQREDGVFRWHLCRALPERRHDALVAWLGTFTDIHDQKTEEERAQAAVRARDEFLLIAAHELNTPLTSLQLQLQRIQRAILKGVDDRRDTLAESVEVAERSVRRLGKLVQTLLDVSRITVGRLTLEPEPLDLAALARDVVGRLSDEARAAGCTVELDAADPVQGEFDKNRIDQVVTNLVTNAIKYGDRKPIQVQVKRLDGHAKLMVCDHGIGIAEADQARIFQRFQRAAHGGNVDVVSHPGDGSTFTVTLPL
jgi:PAS domain S-box-containing protein